LQNNYLKNGIYILLTCPNEHKKEAIKYFDEIDGDRRLNTNEDNFEVRIFFPVIYSVLSQLAARFRGKHEVIEIFFIFIKN